MTTYTLTITLIQSPLIDAMFVFIAGTILFYIVRWILDILP
jgi:hypothetical protein